MSKVGGRRNYGYGKALGWAGKNALKDRYGKGHFATQAAHAARWAKFVEFLKSEGVRDARDVTRELVRTYAAALADQVETTRMSVRYAQNLVSTVNVVLETMRGDRRLRISPARLVGQRINVRERPPVSLDRRLLADRLAMLARQDEHRVALVAALARDFGLRFREASLLDARRAYAEAQARQQINVTRGTKGGRGKEIDRWVSVTPEGMQTLARAAAVQADRENLVPAGMNFRAWRDHAYAVWARRMDGRSSGFHDLRVAYACERYAALTGALAPVVAGQRLASREADRAARQIIAHELGHGRIEVAAVYIGTAR